MDFEADNDTTLDESVPIIVRYLSKKEGRYDEEEYIFQFALNKKEIKQLQGELKKALKVIKALHRRKVVQPKRT